MVEFAEPKELRNRAQQKLDVAEHYLKRARYLFDIADAFDDLKIAADAAEKEHGPNFKLVMPTVGES